METIEILKKNWDENNKKFSINEDFPKIIVDYAIRIKNFMKPENRKFQGALGNARGMLEAVTKYSEQVTISNSEKFKENIDIIFNYLLSVRSTSQVPLNTTWFISQKLKKLNEKNGDIAELKEALLEQCKFHIKNYKIAREKIAKFMSYRIVDRCEEYGQDKIVIGTHCHSGAVIKAIIQSKDYIDHVVVSKTEPEQQGVLTAYDLCKEGIKVNLINLEQYGTAFRRVNLFLFGMDAVSVEGTVLNKAGTRLIATLARTKELPIYFLGETYKYARNTLFGGLVRIERRDVTERLLFNHLNVDLNNFYEQGMLTTNFQAFDTTKAEFYESIVSEQGFLPMREAFEKEWRDYL